MTSVPAPLIAPRAEALEPAPITCAGIAVQRQRTQHIRLSADSLRPYVGILGVLLGAILSFTRQPRHELSASPICAAACTSGLTKAPG